MAEYCPFCETNRTHVTGDVQKLCMVHDDSNIAWGEVTEAAWCGRSIKIRHAAIESALEHAERGWLVLPCNPANKQPLTRNGVYDANTDPDSIDRRWRRTPEAMIGVACGSVSGVFVLDINAPQGMRAAQCIQHLVDEGYILPDQLVSQTPNGAHVWMRLPKGARVGNRGKLLGGIIDCVRGDSGYAIAPGSVNALGGEYNWTATYSARQLHEANDKLIELVTARG